MIGLSTLSRPNRPNRRSWPLIHRSMEMAASLPDPMASASEPESWTRTLKVVLVAGPERGEGEVAHQLYTPTDIVSTRLRWLNPPPEDASAAQPGCLRDSLSLCPAPKTAKSNGFSRRTVPRLGILCTPQGAAKSSRRRRPPPRFSRPLPIGCLSRSRAASCLLPHWTTREAACTRLDIAGVSFPHSA